MKYLFSCGLLSISLTMVGAGCSDAPVEVAAVTSSMEIINTHCPIMGSPVDKSETDPALLKDWNGKKVAFCCPPCLEEWDELTDAEKAQKVSAPPAGHGEESHGHTEGETAPPADAATTPADKP